MGAEGLRRARAAFLSVAVAAAAGLVGAVGLSLLAVLVSALLEPDTFGDQQFVVGLAFTVALGGSLGGVTGAAVRLSRGDHRTLAGWIAAAGGAAVVALATSIAWGSAFSGDGGRAEFAYMMVSSWIAPSLLWGAGLVAWGSGRVAGRR